ncbi:hypothetical protein [Mesobacillus maritimus]|uniref:hypothetical protein n=1 Tax=Mesobacillus maritimus TaxID=1643336 RepID=UPI00384E4D08
MSDIKELVVQVKRVADSLDILVKNLTVMNSSMVNQNKKVEVPQTEISPIEELDSPSTSLEEAFFKEITKVYFHEAIRVKENDLQRKSSVIVAEQLVNSQINFLLEHVSNCEISIHKGGVLAIKKDGKAKALLRIYTDLGYGYRGERWITERNGIADILSEAMKLGIPDSKVYFLVISWANGIDNQHIRKMLNHNISNKDILKSENRYLLKEYLDKYFKVIGNYLPNPKEQIHLLSGGDMHPNVYARDILEGKDITNIKNYSWFSPSITQLIDKLNNV